MIRSLTIDYTQEMPKGFGYLKGRRGKQMLPKNIKFKPGLNVVIGENGCGKSTLLNLLSTYCFCKNGFPRIPDDVGVWDTVEAIYPKAGFLSGLDGREKDWTPISSVRLEHDFDYPVMKMRHIMGYNNDEVMSSIQRLSDLLEGSRQSSGQNMLHSVARFTLQVQQIAKAYTRHSPIPKGCFNSTYQEVYDNIRKWIDTTTIPMDDGRPTVIMDEPDSSLDIKHLLALRKWLTYSSMSVQVIVVLHNPLLIRSLADANANIIQLSKGYLKMIKEF